jgi:hypothetical protein
MNAPLNDVDLKPCPFCDNAPRTENTVTEFVIRCAASWCGASIKRKHVPHDDYPAMERAARAWNTRGGK